MRCICTWRTDPRGNTNATHRRFKLTHYRNSEKGRKPGRGVTHRRSGFLRRGNRRVTVRYTTRPKTDGAGARARRGDPSGSMAAAEVIPPYRPSQCGCSNRYTAVNGAQPRMGARLVPSVRRERIAVRMIAAQARARRRAWTRSHSSCALAPAEPKRRRPSRQRRHYAPCQPDVAQRLRTPYRSPKPQIFLN